MPRQARRTRLSQRSSGPQVSRRSWLASVLLGVGGALLAACGPGGTVGNPTNASGRRAPDSGPGGGGGSAPLRIVCTTGMVADVVAGVAGDHAQITTLMGAGVDPHLYRPTRTDVSAIMDADMVFYNGLLLEGKMTDTLVRAASGGRTVWPITELIDEGSLLSPDDLGGHFDPHVWMDPPAWRETVAVVRTQLDARRPAASPEFLAAASAYEAKIDRLHEYAQRVLSSVPQNQRLLVTSHDAFNYFGRRYGLEVVGIQGISTESEAGVRDVERLVDMIVTRGIKAVFVETTVSDRNIRALIDGAAARGHAVVIGGSLFSDAMGAPGTYEGTYIGMIDHNVTVVARALGGEAPERGMDGLLAEATP